MVLKIVQYGTLHINNDRFITHSPAKIPSWLKQFLIQCILYMLASFIIFYQGNSDVKEIKEELSLQDEERLRSKHQSGHSNRKGCKNHETEFLSFFSHSTLLFIPSLLCECLEHATCPKRLLFTQVCLSLGMELSVKLISYFFRCIGSRWIMF